MVVVVVLFVGELFGGGHGGGVNKVRGLLIGSRGYTRLFSFESRMAYPGLRKLVGPILGQSDLQGVGTVVYPGPDSPLE